MRHPWENSVPIQHLRSMQSIEDSGIQHEPGVLEVHQHPAHRSYGNSVEFAESFDTTGVIGMPFVIAEPCVDVQDQACVSVCPVACIQCEGGKDRKFYIDPGECIDCGACEPTCPVEAIYADFDLPYTWIKYAEIDALWYCDKDAARAILHPVKTKA